MRNPVARFDRMVVSRLGIVELRRFATTLEPEAETDP